MINSKATLLVRMPNWIGDVIMTLPSLQAMQALNIEVQLIGKPWLNSLLSGCNFPIHRLSNSFWHNLQTTHSPQLPQKMILMTNSLSSALLGRLGGKKTLGYATDGRGLLLEKRITKPKSLHEVELFWNLSRLACEHWFNELTWTSSVPNQLHLPISDCDKLSVQKILAQSDVSEPYWILCPFAIGKGQLGGSKIWPYWRQLSKQLSKQHQLIVCPGPNERLLCDRLVPEAKVLDKLTLGQYAAILANAQQVIANDSGPMHISTAVGTPTLGIFGVSNPQRVRPWGGEYLGHCGQWPDLTTVLQYCHQYD